MCKQILVCVFPAAVRQCLTYGLAMLTAVAAAAEPPGATSAANKKVMIDLLASDSVGVWNRDPMGLQSWSVKDGKLAGNGKSASLVLAKALADFELRVDWKVANGGVIKLGFARKPEAKPVEIRLAEQPGISIRLPQGAKILKVDAELAGQVHRLSIKRVGGQIVLECDGVKSREMPVPADEQFGLSLAVEGGESGGSVEIDALTLLRGADKGHVSAVP